MSTRNTEDASKNLSKLLIIHDHLPHDACHMIRVFILVLMSITDYGIVVNTMEIPIINEIFQ